MADNPESRRSPPADSAPNVLIRLAVGIVFLNEGVLKFLDPATYADGRFAALGLPHAELLGRLVAIVETAGGLLVLVGWLTGLAALALFVDITAAIVITKIPVLLGHAYLGLTLMKLKSYGLLSMVHEARTDLAMWFALCFLLIVGPGRWSVDGRRSGA